MGRAGVTWRHRAWVVAGITFAVLVMAAALRSSTGVLIEPVSGDLGWSVQSVSLAVTVNLVLYGLVAPFAFASTVVICAARIPSSVSRIVASSTMDAESPPMEAVSVVTLVVRSTTERFIQS